MKTAGVSKKPSKLKRAVLELDFKKGGDMKVGYVIKLKGFHVKVLAVKRLKKSGLMSGVKLEIEEIKAGAPSMLDKEMCSRIERIIVDGGTMEKVAEECGVPLSTIESWHATDYRGFREKMAGWRRQKMLKKAEGNIEEIMALRIVEDVDVVEDGKVVSTHKAVNDPRIVRVISGMSQFVSETLGKKHYSKRSELTGPDGKDLPVPILEGKAKPKE